MAKCDKRITRQTQVVICGKPVYEGTFCKFHYRQNVTKNIPYKDRLNYKRPTWDEMRSGVPLFLRDKPTYNGHRYRGGFIINLNRKNPIPTKYPATPELFMIKIKKQ